MIGMLMINKQGRARSPLDEAAIDQFVTTQMATQRIPGLAVAIAAIMQLVEADEIDWMHLSSATCPTSP
jgi:hypothetical protein